MPTAVFKDLYELWCKRGRSDEYVGSLVNAYISSGGKAVGVKAGYSYVDVGTFDGYHEAIKLLNAVETNTHDRSHNVMERAQ